MVVWKPPNHGIYKLNTDAGINKSGKCVGFGMVIHDSEGFVMATSS